MVEARGAHPIRALAAICSLIAAAAAAPQAFASGEPCSVTTALEPPSAFVGQQILYRARVARRADIERVEWGQAPTFPAFRSEWLPGRPEDTTTQSHGVRYFVREEHRALFATRAGVLEIPGVTLLCLQPASGQTRKRSHRISLPPSYVRIEALPQSSAPPGFRGLVGPVQVQTNIDRTRIELGGSVRVSVLLRGAANLWDAGAPLRELDQLPAVEIFRDPPTIELQTGDKLYALRAFRFDVVPGRVGSLLIPETRVAYFDPESGRYAFARAPAIEVEVLRLGSGESAQPEAGVQSGSRKSSELPSKPSSAAWGIAALAGLGSLGAGAWWLKRRRGIWQSVDEALADARAAGEQGDARGEAAGYELALRAALAVTDPELQSSSPGALRTRAEGSETPRSELRDAAAVLAKLERIRFAPGPGRPDAPEAEQLLARLRRKRERTR